MRLADCSQGNVAVRRVWNADNADNVTVCEKWFQLDGVVQPLMDGSGSLDPLHSVWIAWSRQLCVMGSPKFYAQPRQGSLKRRRPWRPCYTYGEVAKNWSYAQSSGHFVSQRQVICSPA
jgi:hypothetical protein